MSHLALVTGASSGIGRELAWICAREGHELILAARRKDKIDELAEELKKRFNTTSHCLRIDLSDEQGVPSLLGELKKAGLKPDILINNAGTGLYGPFLESDPDRVLKMMRLNMNALVHLSHALAPAMAASGSGRILNVASTAAFQPGPLMAVYYASKAFVLSFSEALHQELSGSGVSVTALCPGPTHSEFQETAGMGRNVLFDTFIMDTRAVAYAGFHGMMKGRAVVIPGFFNKLLAFSTRLSPRFLTRKIVALLQKETRHST